MDVANLGLRVDSSQLSTATGRMNAFALAGTKAHGSAKGLSAATASLGVAAAGAATGVAGLVAAALSIGQVTRTIADFEHGMARVAAVSGATGESFVKLRQQAKDLGSTTEFSATQAAGGMQFLAQAGFDANEILTALPTTLDLATAAAVDMGTAADIASNILGGFQMQASELAGVADVLAMTTSKSNTSLTQLGGAMSFVAPLANAANVSIQETAASIGVLSDAGIQGSRAGTTLSGVIRRLQAPSDTAKEAIQSLGISMEDVDLRGETLAEAMAKFAEKGLDAATAAKIFEAEAAPGAIVLANNADAAAEFSEKLEQAGGSLEKMAEIMRDNLRGDINSLWSAVEGLVLELGDAGLTDVLRGAVQGATALVRAISDLVVVGGQMMSVLQLPESIQSIFSGVADAASFLVDNLDRVATAGAALAAIMITRTAVAIGTNFVAAAASAVTQSIALEMALGATSKSAALAGVAIKGATAALRVMKGVIITTGIGALVIGLGEAIHFFGRLVSATGSFGDAMAALKDIGLEVWERIKLAASGAMAVMDGQSQKATAAIIGYLADVVDRAAEFGAKMVDVATGSYDAFVAAFSNLPSSLGSAMKQAANAVIAGVEGLINGIIGAINRFTGGLNAMFAMLPDWATPDGKGISFGEISSVSLSRMQVAGETMAQTASAAYAAAQGVTEFNGAGDSLRATADNIRITGAAATAAGKAAMDMATRPLESMSVLRKETEGSASAMETAAEEARKAAGAIGGGVSGTGTDGSGGGGGGKKGLSGAAKDAADKIKELREEAARMNLNADPVKKYNAEVEKLNKLLDFGLSQEAYSDAISDLNDELASSIPLVDEVTDAFGNFFETGFSDFEGFISDVWSGFKGLLSNMAKAAFQNRIVIPIAAGITGGGGIAGAASQAIGGAAGGGGGLLSGLLGTAGTAGAAGSGFLGGISGSLSGGIGNFFNIGANAAAAGGGIGAMLGAAAGPVGLALGVASLFKSTKEIVANGVRIIINDAESEISSYEKSKRTNGLGISSGFSKDYDRLDDTVQATVAGRLDNLIQGLDQLGLNSNLTGFRTDNNTEVKDGETFEGEMEEVIRRALDNATEYAVGGALDAVMKSGETASEAVERLAGSLTSVNAILDDLGHQTYQLGLSGADAASQLADLFGGLEAMTQSTQFYYNTFYTEAERAANATQKVTAALEEHNARLPQTRAEYRRMVESADLSTESGRALYATLLSLGSTMDQILPSIEATTSALSGFISNTTSATQEMSNAIRDVARDAAQSASDWYRAANSIRDFIDDVLFGGSSSQPVDVLFRSQKAAMDKAMQAALGGDVDAAGEFASLSKNYLATARSQAGSLQEYRRIENQVLAQANKLAGVSELTGAARTVAEKLAEQQLSVLEDLNNYIQSTEQLDPEVINDFRESLNGLDKAIREASSLTFTGLKEKLDVAVKLAASEDIPDYLKAALSRAEQGIVSTLEFAVRDTELSDEMRWLAVQGASQHIKTIQYIADNEMPHDMTMLALQGATHVTKTIRMIAQSEIGEDEKRIALAGSSELVRTIYATISSSVSDDAKRMALVNTKTMSVNVQAALEANANVRKIVFQDIGSYVAMVEAVLSADMSEAARRITLKQQGVYVANIGAILDRNMSDGVKRILLNSNTTAIRGITISYTMPGLTHDERLLLRERSTNAMRKIGITIDQNAGSVDQLLLRNIEKGTQRVNKTIRGEIDMGRLSSSERALLEAINGSSAGKITMDGGVKFDPSDAFNSSLNRYSAKPLDQVNRTLKDMRRHLRIEGMRGAYQTLMMERSNPNISKARKAEIDEARGKLRTLSSSLNGGTPAFANGGDHAGGWRIVGENGPEIEKVGPARYHTAEQTAAMFNSSGSGVVEELKALRREVTELRSQSGAFSSEQLRQQKRSADLLERQELRQEEL